MMTKKIKVIAIAGPTASGKSALALALAKRFGGEIVSCDSMQVYRGMDIGTAKPTVEEMAGIPHHMIDLLAPEENFSCGDFVEAAHRCIAGIAGRGALPILCGGTGLYMDNVLWDTELCAAGEDPAYRAELELLDSPALHEKLREIDPESAGAIHENNRKRVIRALEIFKVSGMTKTEWDRRSRVQTSRYDALRFTLTGERALLYERIERRVDLMMEQGLLDEVRALLPRLGKTAAQAIGYKELGGYLRGECSLPEAVALLKQSTRNYAKRQLTWSAHHLPETQIFLPIDGKTPEELLAQITPAVETFLA